MAAEREREKMLHTEDENHDGEPHIEGEEIGGEAAESVEK